MTTNLTDNGTKLNRLAAHLRAGVLPTHNPTRMALLHACGTIGHDEWPTVLRLYEQAVDQVAEEGAEAQLRRMDAAEASMGDYASHPGPPGQPLGQRATACAVLVRGGKPCPNEAAPGLQVQGDPACDECYHDADEGEGDWF